MTIKNHKLQGEHITWQKTPNTGGAFATDLPDTLVIHFTGGRSAASSANWLCNPKAKASAHLVIGRDGHIYQLADFKTITWHAGRSSWAGRSGLNQYSIGVELDNAGRLEKREAGYFTWFGHEIPPQQVVHATHRHEEAATYWQSYTEAQLEITEQICELLADHYPITTVVGHEEISPGRKVDPGPAFPLEAFRRRLLPEDRGINDHMIAENNDTKPLADMGLVSADRLNIRTQPTTTAPVVTDPLRRGTKVTITARQAGWLKVKTTTEGWVSGEWVR